MTQQSNKYKPYVVCHCRHCKASASGSGRNSYRQGKIKASKRRYRHRIRQQLKQGLSVDLSRVSAGYTD